MDVHGNIVPIKFWAEVRPRAAELYGRPPQDIVAGSDFALTEVVHSKSRSTAFRYKGKESDPQKVGSELNVQAVLSGRMAQRGDDLTLSPDLVDTRAGNQLWGVQYSRKLTGSSPESIKE